MSQYWFSTLCHIPLPGPAYNLLSQILVQVQEILFKYWINFYLTLEQDTLSLNKMHVKARHKYDLGLTPPLTSFARRDYVLLRDWFSMILKNT